MLYKKFGKDLFIFSAGWGIIKADYKLPQYDVTFSKASDCVRRKEDDLFKDFNHLENIKENEEIWLIAGKDYVIPFCKLTKHLPNKKIIIYKSCKVVENNPYMKDNNFEFKYYKTNARTNWHYECAKQLINQ